MPTFWKSFFGSFLGKITSVLFITVCMAIGFGPDEWAKYLLNDLPVHFNPRAAQILLLILGAITLFFLSSRLLSSLFTSFKKKVIDFLSDIVWFDGPHSIHTFGYVISKPNNIVLVDHIRLRGKNTKKSSIFVKVAYMRSLVSGEQIKAKINNLDAENLEIFKGSSFDIYFSLPNEDGALANNHIKGISFQKFLQRFSNFEIVIETDKKNHIIEFDDKETKNWVSLIQNGLMMPAPGEKARVLKKR